MEDYITPIPAATSTGSYLGVFPCVAGLAVVGIVIAYLLMHPPERVTV